MTLGEIILGMNPIKQFLIIAGLPFCIVGCIIVIAAIIDLILRKPKP